MKYLTLILSDLRIACFYEDIKMVDLGETVEFMQVSETPLDPLAVLAVETFG